MASWVNRWRDRIAPRAALPGVWRRQAGGYRIRGRATDPRTGRMVEINRPLPDAPDAPSAFAELQRLLGAIRAGAEGRRAAPERLAAFAERLYARKVQDGTIRSAKGREKWRSIWSLHIEPAFGEIFCDRLTRADFEEYRGYLAGHVAAGRLAPGTANSWLAQIRSITRAMAADLDLPDPMRGVRDLDARTWRTYTPEEPNALTPSEIPAFLAAWRALYPQHVAFVFLGLVTGLRPSSLRPLRRRGPAADLKWERGLLLVRRSHTRRQEILETTKTGADYAIALPRAVIDELAAHVARLEAAGGPPAASDLLFPSTTGGLRTSSGLDQPFRAVARALGLDKRLTPRCLRRTYQDAMRAAGVAPLVARSISGHASEAMAQHYATAGAGEQREALARVAALALGTAPQVV